MSNTKQEFIKLFSNIAKYHHRYKVWSDFISMSAYSLYNAYANNDQIEQDYLKISAQYKNEDLLAMSKLLALVVKGLEEEYQDFLGSVYMDLELGNSATGQFFTPYCVSKMMAQMSVPKDLKPGRVIKLHEPAAGSGGCIIAVADVIKDLGVNPQEKLFVSCIELDSTVALMCYIQLSLLGVAAEVMIGNSLSLNITKTFITPMFFVKDWDNRLRIDNLLSTLEKTSISGEFESISEPKQIIVPPSKLEESEVKLLTEPVSIIRNEEEQLILF